MESCLHAGKSPIRFFALGKRGHKTIKSKLKFSDGSFPSRQKLALVFSCLSGLIVGLEMLLTASLGHFVRIVGWRHPV